MGNTFPRNALGYNQWWTLWGMANIDNNNSLTLNLPSNSGEVLGFLVRVYGGSITDYTNFLLTITIDGVQIWNNLLRSLLLVYLGNNAHSLFATNDQPAASNAFTQFAFRMPFDGSGQFKFTGGVGSGVVNTSVVVFYRVAA